MNIVYIKIKGGLKALDIMDKMIGIFMTAIIVGALITQVLGAVINITLPDGLSSFQIFFEIIIPVLIIFGVVKVFRMKAG